MSTSALAAARHTALDYPLPRAWGGDVGASPADTLRLCIKSASTTLAANRGRPAARRQITLLRAPPNSSRAHSRELHSATGAENRAAWCGAYTLAMLLAAAALVLWIFVWLVVALRVVRRDDLGVGGKAFWLLIILVLPFVGLLIYFLWDAARPRSA